MKYKLIFPVLFLISISLTQGQDLKSKKVNKLITKKWYSQKIGSTQEDMRPSNKEDMEFRKDGTVLLIQKGGMTAGEVLEATWKFDEETQKLQMTLEMMGESKTVELDIIELTSDKLLISKPGRIVEYGLEPLEEEE
jgi:hypothetical protein